MEIWRQKGKIVQGSKQYVSSTLQLDDRERPVVEARDERYSTLRRERELSTRVRTLHLGTFSAGEEAAGACDQAAVQERGKTAATLLTDASEYADGGTLNADDAVCAASTSTAVSETAFSDSIRQHTSAYDSIRQHTSAYVSTSTALSETAFSDRERPVERHDERESCEKRETQRWSCSPPNSRSSSGVLWGEGESEWRADGRGKERVSEERLQQEVDEKWAAAHACMRRVAAELRYPCTRMPSGCVRNGQQRTQCACVA
jgi:hypothetical protein